MDKKTLNNLLIRACKSKNKEVRIKKLISKYTGCPVDFLNDADLFHFILEIGIDCGIFSSAYNVQKFFSDTSAIWYKESSHSSYVRQNLLGLIGQISILKVSELPNYFTKPKKFK